MIVLPNSFERYLSALRIFVSLSILKHGLKPRHLASLKKIYYAEAFYNKNSRQSVDIKKLSTNILNTITTYKYRLNFSCNLKNNYHINKNLFTLLLLEISSLSNFISISSDNNFVVIKFSSKKQNPTKTLYALGGFSFHEAKYNTTLFVIPAEKTNHPSVYIESEWENIFDQFSTVNIFLKNILYP